MENCVSRSVWEIVRMACSHRSGSVEGGRNHRNSHPRVDEKLSNDKFAKITPEVLQIGLRVIIGAGNSNEHAPDLERHCGRFNVAFSPEPVSSEGDAKGLLAFPYCVPSPEFDEFIDRFGHRITLLAIDVAVCAVIGVTNIMSWHDKLASGCVMYIPYPNLQILCVGIFADVKLRPDNKVQTNKLEQRLQKKGYTVVFCDDNKDLSYPIAPRYAEYGGKNLVADISYMKLTRV